MPENGFGDPQGLDRVGDVMRPYQRHAIQDPQAGCGQTPRQAMLNRCPHQSSNERFAGHTKHQRPPEFSKGAYSAQQLQIVFEV
ncbi:MAG: hypothetical protein L6Q38_16245, partial [Nitrospira sp.]|nr:hypothetical protein [Nitrospira sp.]